MDDFERALERLGWILDSDSSEIYRLDTPNWRHTPVLLKAELRAVYNAGIREGERRAAASGGLM